MQKKLWIGALAVTLAAGVAAAGAWNWVLGPTLAASGPVTAVPLESSQGAEATSVLSGQETTFQISTDDSEVRFMLSEVLRGELQKVVGHSNQVAGEIAVNYSDLSSAQVGVITINARTLATDDEQRNRAIRNRILGTDSYEYITFTPRSVLGLQGSAQPGDSFTFQIQGDLTIRGVTKPVVFDVTVKAVSEGELSGMATAVVQRSDFGLAIPSVPFVANVGEDVSLEFEFVAIAS